LEVGEGWSVVRFALGSKRAMGFAGFTRFIQNAAAGRWNAVPMAIARSTIRA
jgi:hypothetical protein